MLPLPQDQFLPCHSAMYLISAAVWECFGWSIDPYIEKLLAENTRLVLLKKCQDHAGVSIAFPFWNLATLSHWKSPRPRHNLSMILHVWFLPLPIHPSASTYIYQPMEVFPDLSGVELVSGPCSFLPQCPKCMSVRGPSTPSNFALLVFLLLWRVNLPAVVRTVCIKGMDG